MKQSSEEGSQQTGAPQPGLSRRRFLGAMAAMGASWVGLGRAATAEGRELYLDRDAPAPEDPEAQLFRLLRYLGLDYADFEPREARYFAALRDLLARFDVVRPQEALGCANFQNALQRFQRGRSMVADGIPDEDTLWELQVDWARSRRLDFVRIEADLWPGRGGQRGSVLRQDAAAAYGRLRQAVKELGGVVTSDGALRELTAEVSAGRSSTSHHYLGLAFDLATSTGMQDTGTDPYIIEREGPGWHVWARAAGGTERTLDAVLWRRGQVTTERTTARVVDFTAMANRHGFRDIGYRSDFPRDYSCAEWWHFQYEAALVPFISQFGIELMSLGRYTESALKTQESLWDRRQAIFRRPRNGWNSTPGPAR